MNKKQTKERVESLLKEREIITEQMISIAKKIDSKRPWKSVLRTELGVII